MAGSRLIQRIQDSANRAGLTAVAVSFYDYESTVHFSYHADRPFHAASTIKLAFLFALFREVDKGRLKLESRLHVRNRFRSVVDGSIYRLDPGRDADTEIYRKLGRAVPVLELARAMIVRSSNFATNLLFDLLGLSAIRSALEEAGIEGIRVERGVEDETAFGQGLNNEVTADGLIQLLRVLCERRFLTERSCEQLLEILFAQEFNRMIPAKLPPGTRVAHKTGEISTVCHDAGIVFLPDRQPYALAILTENTADHDGRQKAVAAISGAIFHYLRDVVKRDE
jgi:beta-lactamase class A